ncbi:aspartic peptidase domain-containing protein [Phaeosphaeriaceae sp. PMI808]|nr:aspartic peptidase domain-containing protein [Phaeosphaeriaceae sp. PMI808]
MLSILFDNEVNNTNATHPAPILVPPTGKWDGVNEDCSTFNLSVGNPPQYFRVLPATNDSAVVVPAPEACGSQDPINCPLLRGVENGRGFNSNQSSTWKQIGLWKWWRPASNTLNIAGNANMGFDTVTMSGLNASNTLVGAYGTRSIWLGQIPLHSRAVSFEESKHYSSLIVALYDTKQIPSKSYSYTAGAKYRTPSYPGSLVLGGYDASRFKETPGNYSFPFDYSNDKGWTSLGVSSIFITQTLNSSSLYLSQDRFTAFIDSSTPYIWLPQAACDKFADSLGLAYHSEQDLYFVNDTVHERLKQLNPTITFQLGNNNDPTTSLNIDLPYGAFDKQTKRPFYNETRRYFPIRRAANSSQFVLGRPFLQEAYLITDYSRKYFHIQQARFESSIPAPDIQFIPQYMPSNNTNKTTTPDRVAPNRLSTPAIVGISAGSVVGVIAILLLALIYLHRKKTEARAAKSNTESTQEDSNARAEMEGGGIYEAYESHFDAVGSHVQYEMDANALHLLSDDRKQHCLSDGWVVHEMPAETE